MCCVIGFHCGMLFFKNGNNQSINQYGFKKKKILCYSLVSYRPLPSPATLSSLVRRDKRHPLPQKRDAEKKLEKSNSELSALEFQNRLLKLTAEIILWENKILSLPSQDFDVKKKNCDPEEPRYEPGCINNTLGHTVEKGDWEKPE